MKATHKRYLAAAFATVGLMSLGAAQTTPDAMTPSQEPVIGQAQNQTGAYAPDTDQPSTIQSVPTTQAATVSPDQSTTTNLGVDANGAPIVLDTSNVPTITLNGTQVTFTDAQPGMINGQLMIPVRTVAEQLGATVQWADQDKQVMIELPSTQSVTLDTNRDWIALIANQDQGSMSGPSADMGLSGSEVVLIGNRAYMPFDQLASAIHGSGDWDRNGSTATISTDQPSPPDLTAPDQPITSPDSQPEGTNGTPLDDDKTSGGTGTTPLQNGTATGSIY
jgi:hypothetical protein